MDIFLTDTDRKKIHKSIYKKYKKVAENPTDLFNYPTGRAGLEGLKYPSELIEALPEAVADSYCGVGNPFALGTIKEEEAILDVGCGSGVDAIFAAMLTGPSGNVVGVDLTPEMLQRAKKNLGCTDLKNITFGAAAADNLPFSDQNFDVVLSNGAFNLVVDKPKALSEVFRVLRPNGHLMIADQILTAELPEEKKQIVKRWAR